MPELHHKQHVRIDLNLNIRGLNKSTTLEINEKSRELQKQGKKVYRLGFGQSPFPVPEPVVQALRDHAQEKDYLPVKGLYELREVIAEFYNRKQNLKRTAEDILIGPGSKELLFILQLVYYGDLVIPKPSWVSYSPQAVIVGRKVQWVDTHSVNDRRLTPEMLEAICEQDPSRPRIAILNYPANPTGATYTVERLKKIAEVARKYRMLLLSDEIYGELHHTGQHVSIARFYPEGTIISTGLSKWCGAGGWRLGTFIFPPSLRWLLDAMAIVASETFTSTSAPIQYAGIEAFKESAEIEKYLKNARNVLRVIGKAMHARLEKMRVAAPKPQGGFYLFPDFDYYRESLARRGMATNKQLCERLLADTGIALLPSGDFGCPPEDLTARLSYVDFDGQKALDLAESYGEKPLDMKFVKACSPDMLEAMDEMEKWLKG
jgi:aspartate/methionine/tyrosine aminotransferase